MPQTSGTAHVPRPSTFALFVVGYVLAVYLAERTYGSLSLPSPFWLPDSVLLCALLLVPRAQWWLFALVIWPIRLVVGAVPGTPMWFELLTLANDTAKGLAAAWLLQRLLRRPITLNTLQEFMVFLAITAVALPAASALAAAPARAVLGDAFWPAASGWFLGDAVTQVVVTPTLLYWCRRDFGLRRRLAELLVIWLFLAGALFVGFVADHRSYSLLFVYVPIPFLIWAAVRVGPFGTANALSLMAIVSMVAAVDRDGIFADASSANAVLSIQLFLLVVASSLLMLAILIGEREALQAREVVLSSRLIDAQDNERSRIAAELHDDIGQQIAMLLIEINHLAQSADIPEQGRQALRTLSDAATRMSSDIKKLSHTLHPLTVGLIGLEPAVRNLCEQFSGRWDLQVELRCRSVPFDVPEGLSLCVYRLVQEALRNAAQHSGASGATVELFASGRQLTVCVSDAGRGFDTGHTGRRGGLGLISIAERVRSLGGELTIDARPQHGTQLRAVLPLAPTSPIATTRNYIQQLAKRQRSSTPATRI